MVDTIKNRTVKTDKDTLQTHTKPLVITSGEPAGIGMDIVLQLGSEGRFKELDRPVWVIADGQAMAQRAQMLFDKKAISRLPRWRSLVDLTENIGADEVVDSNVDKVTEDKIVENKATEDKVIEKAISMLSSLDITADNDSMLMDVKNAQGIDKNIEDIDDSKVDDSKVNDSKVNDNEGVDFLLIDIRSLAPVEAGILNPKNALMVMQQLTIAHELAYRKIAAAIVTAPLQKSILIDADIRLQDGTMFTGHTEFFMQLSGRDKVVMMLANTAMKVALVTTHLPLKEVAAAVTKQNVEQTVTIVLNDLKTKFGMDNPRILVCGLNPHAGEGGHLGMEEVNIINPVLKQFQERGVDISDAMPADTLFTKRHLQRCDAVIAMYHDQGLPVLKSHGFGDTVNLTLGLPYIRTSVDHGTALDLAGSGQASASSLWQALLMGNDMASKSGL